MKTRKLLTVFSCISFLLVTGVLPISVVYAKQIELSWVSLTSKDHSREIRMFDRAFINRVNERAKGELFISTAVDLRQSLRLTKARRCIRVLSILALFQLAFMNH